MELKKMEIIFWRCVVEVTQIPSINKRDTNEISWFRNPFNDLRVYGTKFSFGRKDFSWKFYMNAVSEKSAIRAGVSLLSYLKELYIGLDGTIRAKPIGTVHLLKDRPDLYEIYLPHPPYLNNQIPLIQKIVNLADTISNHYMKIYIFWQFKEHLSSQVMRDETKSTRKFEFHYNLRIIVEVKLAIGHNSMEKRKFAELLGYLDYLKTDIQKAKLRKADIPAQNLLTMAKLFSDAICMETSIFDGDTNLFSKKIRTIDFSIPSNMRLDKAIDVQNENLSFSNNNIHKDKDIFIGYLYLNGVKSKKKKYLPVNHFVHNTLITGMLGSGKTHFNAHIWKEYKLKRADIGGLNINYFKRNQEIFYDSDIILDKDSPDFLVPYYFEQESNNRSLLETACYLTASQGLGNEAAKVLHALMKDIIKSEGELPRRLEDLFKKLLERFKVHNYSINYKKDITTMIETSILDILSDPNLNRILRLTNKVPKWILEWNKGKKIYLDLSGFNKHEQRLLTFALFHMMIKILPAVESDKLQSIIQIDEVFKIFSLSKNINPNNYDFIALTHLEDVFEELVKSFRSRGIAFILSDSTPSRLFDYIISLFSLKIIFRTGFPNYNLFTNNLVEQDQLVRQPNRRAIVINGMNGEKYAIYTPDFSFSSHFNQLSKGAKFIEKD